MSTLDNLYSYQPLSFPWMEAFLGILSLFLFIWFHLKITGLSQKIASEINFINFQILSTFSFPYVTISP